MIAAGPSAKPRLVLLTELFKLRREINGSRAVARYKDLVSETRLERELESVEATAFCSAWTVACSCPSRNRERCGLPGR